MSGRKWRCERCGGNLPRSARDHLHIWTKGGGKARKVVCRQCYDHHHILRNLKRAEGAR